MSERVNFMQRLPGGICFAHGPYAEMQCPKWPACITDPKKSEFVKMGVDKIAPLDTRKIVEETLRTHVRTSLRTACICGKQFPDSTLETFHTHLADALCAALEKGGVK